MQLGLNDLLEDAVVEASELDRSAPGRVRIKEVGVELKKWEKESAEVKKGITGVLRTIKKFGGKLLLKNKTGVNCKRKIDIIDFEGMGVDKE